jgi:hypothetical protein
VYGTGFVANNLLHPVGKQGGFFGEIGGENDGRVRCHHDDLD